jgi:hypothetical protein
MSTTADRIPLYARLEKLRGRPLIVYVTSSRQQVGQNMPLGLMGSDAIPELLDQLTVIPSTVSKIDFLVVSQGGDPTVAWRAMSLLRERFKEVAVLVPQAAFSAATLLALGADEIVMHAHGNLGPVDPQIMVARKVPGSEQTVEQRFGYEELMGFLEFARNEAGLSDQEHIRALLQIFCQEVGAVPVGIAARSSLLSVSMGEKLLRMHMTGDGDAQKARTIAETLNRKFFHHGYPLGRKEAIDIGLKVSEPNPEVEPTMWDIWLSIEQELQVRKPFNPVAVLLDDQIAGPLLLAPVQQINIPVNIPPQLAQQVLPNILAQVQIQIAQIPPVDFQVVNAIMESTRAASRCVSSGKIIASRMPDLQLRMNAIIREGGWKMVDYPALPPNITT